ncbi:hypothetical protein [Clostridium sp. CF012]|uniref:TolB family protein n=1 Tax=Clostridium sp. CF012 TaxID=2843319 RepID=UPI001C0E22A3|nr:hypothetical protein [Clostridium sp. CF012]MBU3145449.1 hypothetical protein [Clostridium sp. CF012]
MVSDELYIEKLLYKDAAKIVIDNEFKRDLKNRIKFGDKYNNITELSKSKNNLKQSKYFKIASGFVICAFVSGTIFNAIDVPSINMFAKGEGNSNDNKAISSVKNSTMDSGKVNVPKANDQVAISDDVNKIPSIEKDGQGSTVDNSLGKYSKENNGIINKGTGKVNSIGKGAGISEGVNKNQGNTSVSTVIASINSPNVPNIPITPSVPNATNVPKMENVKENVSFSLKLYDSSFSSGEKSLLNVKEGAIYVKDIESSIEKKLIAYNEKTQIVEKPNFTPNNEIIYYKAEKVDLKNGIIGEKNGAIYLTDKNGKEPSKLVDGKNPMISKDGNKLVYETEGKIYILDLETKNKKFIDNGKNPAFSDDGKTISYVKEDKETQNYDENTGKKDVYIQKTFSSLWVFDLATENTHSLTNKEVNINSESIQSWAEAVKSGSVTSDLKVSSKYSYFESIWSSNNKEIYVIRKNNDEQIFELIKIKIDK